MTLDEPYFPPAAWAYPEIASASWQSFWPLAATLLGVSVATGVAAALLARLFLTSAAPSQTGLVAFSISLVGMASGQIAGASRDTVTGDVLPILLTGFGGLAVFSVVQSKIAVGSAAMIAALFTVALLGGLSLGASLRQYGTPNYQVNEPPTTFNLDPRIES